MTFVFRRFIEANMAVTDLHEIQLRRREHRARIIQHIAQRPRREDASGDGAHDPPCRPSPCSGENRGGRCHRDWCHGENEVVVIHRNFFLGFLGLRWKVQFLCLPPSVLLSPVRFIPIAGDYNSRNSENSVRATFVLTSAGAPLEAFSQPQLPSTKKSEARGGRPAYLPKATAQIKTSAGRQGVRVSWDFVLFLRVNVCLDEDHAVPPSCAT